MTPSPHPPLPAGTACTGAAWLASEVAPRHVTVGHECLLPAMLVPAALWTLAAFNLGTLI